MGSINFTKASQGDHDSRVTVALSELGLKPNLKINQGDAFIISFKYKGKSHNVHFYCNRAGSTLKSDSWPIGCPSPRIGSPISLKVTGVFSAKLLSVLPKLVKSLKR